MATLLALALLAGAITVLVRRSKKADLQLTSARAAGRLQHRRSGEFPSSCSWCKSTTLARKLILFRRVDGPWSAFDLMARLAACEDAEVDALAALLTTDHPAWRRLCTERCAREFLATEQTDGAEPFRACEYCATRIPSSYERCIHCGAARRVTP